MTSEEQPLGVEKEQLDTGAPDLAPLGDAVGLSPAGDAGGDVARTDNHLLDLTDEVVQPVKAEPASMTIDVKREDTRKAIAFILLGLLTAVAAAWVIIAAALTKIDPASPVVPALDKIFAGVLALTGTAVGFYFGASSSGTNAK